MRKDYISVRNLDEQGFNLREKNKVLPSWRESVKHFKGFNRQDPS